MGRDLRLIDKIHNRRREAFEATIAAKVASTEAAQTAWEKRLRREVIIGQKAEELAIELQKASKKKDSFLKRMLGRSASASAQVTVEYRHGFYEAKDHQAEIGRRMGLKVGSNVFGLVSEGIFARCDISYDLRTDALQHEPEGSIALGWGLRARWHPDADGVLREVQILRRATDHSTGEIVVEKCYEVLFGTGRPEHGKFVAYENGQEIDPLLVSTNGHYEIALSLFGRGIAELNGEATP